MKQVFKKHANIEGKLKKVLARIEEIVESNERNAVKVKIIHQILGKLTDDILDIHHRSMTDQLTGFVNRWFLNEFLRKEIRLANRYKRELTLAILDMDFLKLINDNFGHNAGDEAISTIAEIIKKNIRSADVVARYGGDEFVIVFPVTDLSEAKKVAERIQKAVSKEGEKREYALSISAGLAQLKKRHKFAEDLIEEADKLLYEEKKKRK